MVVYIIDDKIMVVLKEKLRGMEYFLEELIYIWFILDGKDVIVERRYLK